MRLSPRFEPGGPGVRAARSSGSDLGQPGAAGSVESSAAKPFPSFKHAARGRFSWTPRPGNPGKCFHEAGPGRTNKLPFRSSPFHQRAGPATRSDASQTVSPARRQDEGRGLVCSSAQIETVRRKRTPPCGPRRGGVCFLRALPSAQGPRPGHSSARKVGPHLSPGPAVEFPAKVDRELPSEFAVLELRAAAMKRPRKGSARSPSQHDRPDGARAARPPPAGPPRRGRGFCMELSTNASGRGDPRPRQRLRDGCGQDPASRPWRGVAPYSREGNLPKKKTGLYS